MNNSNYSFSVGANSHEVERLEMLVRSIEELASIGIYEVDLNTGKVFFSDGMYRLLGEEPQSFEPGLGFIDSHSYPEDAIELRRMLEQAIIDKLPCNYTCLIKRKDGEPRVVEFRGNVFYNAEGIAQHFFCVAQDVTEKKEAEQEIAKQKTSDKSFVSVENISEQKEAEADVIKSLTILRQAEEVAAIGSWEYDIASTEIHWSAGMFRLFDIEESQKISPEIYSKFAIKEDLPHVLRIIEMFSKDFIPFEDEIRISVNGKQKHLCIKAIPYYDESGRPIKMLGVDMDITERKIAEAKLRFVEEEKQKAILNAVMETQEEERRRIAEALHNEFGQLLTFTKFAVDGKIPEAEEHLNIAIKLVRSISHELMPPTLQNYGLEIALNDLFSSKLLEAGITFNASISGLKTRLGQVTEIAIYRVIQEIVNNIVKHSKASQADISIRRPVR